MQQVVRRIGRRHPTRLARIGANALRAPADNALGQKILHHLGGWPGGVGASFVGVQEQVFVMRALVPIAAQHNPFASVDGTVLGLPRFHMVDGQQKVCVLSTFSSEIQHVHRGNQALHGQRVGVTIGKILAGDPVMRRVKVGARMLAHFQPVPRPERPVLVIVGNRVNLDFGGVLGEIRRQFQQGRVWPQNAGAIHHLNPARGQHSSQTGQHICRCHVSLPVVMTAHRFRQGGAIVPVPDRIMLDRIKCVCKYQH